AAASATCSGRQSVRLCQRFERGLGSCTEMLDDFGGGEGAEPCRGRKIDIAGKPEQESGREEVARARSIDEPLDGKRRDAARALPRHDPAALLAARDDRQRGVPVQRGNGGVEIRGLIEALELRLVCEREVDYSV